MRAYCVSRQAVVTFVVYGGDMRDAMAQACWQTDALDGATVTQADGAVRAVVHLMEGGTICPEDEGHGHTTDEDV